MANQICQKVIGKACFKAYPSFSRRAIAYRLLHLLIPSDIAKILPKTLKDPLIAPGVEIPLNASFPPGTCIIPGCEFPAGWDPDQEPPDCAKSAPLPPLAMQLSGGIAPSYLTPGPGGPLPTPPPTPAQTAEPWFYDDFATIDVGVWSEFTGADGTPEATAGKLRMKTTIALDTCGIYRFDLRNVPTNFRVTIPLNFSDGPGSIYFQILTGTHHVEFGWRPPNIVWLKEHPTGNTEYVIPWSLGTEYEWKLVFANGYGDLYRDGILVVSAHYFREYTPAAKYMEFFQWDPAETYVASLKIEDLT